MGMLKEMFGSENGEEFEKKPPELLAKGRYKSTPELILSGYKTFQLKYTLKSLIGKLLLVLIALASSVMMLMTSDDSTMPVFMIIICIVIGAYFVFEPVNNRKKLKKGLETLGEAEYEAEITDRTIKISTVSLPEPPSLSPGEEQRERIMETAEKYGAEAAAEELAREIREGAPEESKKTGEKLTDGENENKETPEDEGPPATLIHLDSHIVDFIDREDMFIVCVKKSYVFIIPKSAFTEEEVQKTREKLSAVLGIRFRIAD